MRNYNHDHEKTENAQRGLPTSAHNSSTLSDSTPHDSQQHNTMTTQVEVPEVKDVFRKEDFSKQYTFKKSNKLGDGANGSVYRCTKKKQPRKGQECAVKVLLIGENVPKSVRKEWPKKRYNDTFIKPLKKEATMLLKVAEMHDDSFLKILDAYEDEDRLYIVTELCKGTSLKPYMKKGVPEDAARDIVEKVCKTMAFLNSNGVAHRDLKPDNIMWDPKTEKIKIIDFGCARETKLNDMTTFQGTVSHMAPEIIKKKTNKDGFSAYTSNCDVWSLGVIMFRLLTGQPPFSGGNNANLVMESILNDTPNFDLVESKEAKAFLKKCLDKNPSTREPFSKLKKHAWFKAQLKPSSDPLKSKKSPMKTKLSENYNRHFDGFEYDIMDDHNEELRANNGNDVVTKKKQKKVASKKVAKVQKRLRDMDNDKMPMTKVTLGNFFMDLGLSQDEICQLVDLACEDGFGNGEFKTFCSKKVKNCPIYTGVNQYEEPKKKTKSSYKKVIKTLSCMNDEERPDSKIELNNFLENNKVTELDSKRKLIDEVCKSGFEKTNFLKVAKSFKKCSYYTGTMV